MKIIHLLHHKLLLLLLIIVVTYHSSSAQISGDSWATVKKNGKGDLTCVYGEVTGLIYKEDGQMKGLCVDILNEFSDYVQKKYNKNITINYSNEINEMVKLIKTVQSSSNLIGVKNISITNERKKIVDFSPPFLSNPAVLLTNRLSPNLNSLNDIQTTFQGYTAIAIYGTTHMYYMQDIKKNYYPDLKIEYLHTKDEIFNRLLNDDKVFTSVDFLLYFGAFKDKLPVKRHKVEIGDDTESLGFILHKGSDWTPIFHEFLTTEFRNSQRYKDIVTQNIGSSFLIHIR